MDEKFLLKFKHGLMADMQENSPAFSAGTIYVTRDEQAMYVDLPAYKKGDVTQEAKRVRIGDVHSFDYLEDLTADLNAGRIQLAKTALYYVEKDKRGEGGVVINGLFKWNGTGFVQLNKMSDLAASLTIIEGEVSDLKSKVNVLNDAVTVEGSVLHTVNAVITELNLANTYEAKGEAAKVDEKVTTLSGHVDSEIARVAGLVSDEAARATEEEGKLSAAISGNTTKIGENTTAIGKNAEDIAKNAEEIGKNAKAITDLNTNLSKAIEDAVAVVAGDLSDFEGEVEEKFGDIDDAFAGIEEKQGLQDAEINKKVNIAQGAGHGNVVMVTDENGNVVVGAKVADKLQYLTGLTENVHTALEDIRGDISDMGSAYVAADAVVLETANAYTDNKVAAEATARGTAISSAVAAEALARNAAITNAVAVETSAREQAITSVNGQISDLTGALNDYKALGHATKQYVDDNFVTTTAAAVYATSTQVAADIESAKTAVKTDLIGTENDTDAANTIRGAKAAALKAAGAASDADAKAEAAAGAAATADAKAVAVDGRVTELTTEVTTNYLKKEDAAKTYETIENVKALKEALEGAIADEQSRAEEVEEDFEERIAKMENFWKAADDPNETIDKLAEIVDYINAHEGEAFEMVQDIQKNTKAITDLDTRLTALDKEDGRIATLEQSLSDSVSNLNGAITDGDNAVKTYVENLLAWELF